MVKFFVLSRFIARFYKSNIVFLYFLVTSHNFTVYFQKGFFMINSNTFSNFNSKYPIYADLHTHSISSGHGSEDTITDMIRCASESGLSLFGISDHGPATSSSAKPSYFQSLKLADRDRFGIRVLYGVELNIINTAGDVDLDDEILSALDYAIISIHPPIFKPYHDKDLSSAYICAMDHPKVRFLGHIDDAAGVFMQHMRQDGLNGIEAAAEVYIKDALPCLRLNILKLLLLCDAGVIDEQRDMPQLVLRACDHFAHGQCIGHVRLLPDSVRAVGLEFFSERFGLVGALNAVYAHGVALARERTRDCAADAAGRTGDQCNFFHALSSRSHKSCLLY